MKNRKLVLLGSIGLVLMLAALCLPVACAKPAPAPAAPEWQLKYHNDVPTTTVWHRFGDVPIARSIEEATKGRIKITIYHNETLITAPEMLSGLDSGLVDIGVAMTFSYFGRFPLLDVVSLPFLGISSGAAASRILMDLYYEFPEFQAQFAGYKVLALATLDPYFLVSNKKISTMEEWKGVKIRVPGGPPTDAIKALGGVPTQVDFADLYLALDRGVIDACAAGWALTDDASLYDVVKYYNTDVKFWTYPLFLVMSLKLWNSFPPDIQQAIDSVTGYVAAERYGKDAFDGVGTVGLEKLTKSGAEFVKISEAEMARWAQVAGKPIWDTWVADMDAKGLPGQAVLDKVLQLAKKYK